MRAPALITVAAISAIAVAVLLLTQLPSSPPKPAAATPAPVPVPSVAATATPPEAPPPQAAPPAAETHPVEPAKPDVAPAPKAEEALAAESAADDNADAEVGADEGTDDDDGDASSVDVGRAADLLADWMAKQDATATGEGEAPPPSVQALRTFDHESSDSDWSEATEQQVEAALNQWLDGLPAEVRDHIEIIHVECRETLCQILAADNELDRQNERAQASQEWQQAIATLPQQPWWNELGFVDVTNAVNTDSQSGYILYQTYLRREVKPAG